MPLLQSLNLLNSDSKVIDAAIPLEQYVSIDLSIHNPELSKAQLENADDFEQYIGTHLQKNNATVAYGGYNETRNLYKRSSIFNDTDSNERNIHIGLDLWTKAGTPVLAALDGTLHSFANNTGLGNYGPTIIIEHLVDTVKFYTLYGHLSVESIAAIKIGQTIKKGTSIGTLGDATVNGNYAPHLHFQVINEIGEHSGDYAGVCSENDLAFYLDNCPDPNLLLKLKKS